MKKAEANEYLQLVSWTRDVHMCFTYTGVERDGIVKYSSILSGICEREKNHR